MRSIERGNAAAALEAWFKARLPVWQSYTSWSTARMPTGALLINESFQTNVYNAYYYDLVLKNGSSVENQRQWRGNVVSNYSFESGWLKGWTVGGGARYRSRAKIGYPLKTISGSGGQAFAVTDLDHPYYSSDELTWDALLRYRLKLRGQVINSNKHALSAPVELVWARLPKPREIDADRSYFGLHSPLAPDFFKIARAIGHRRVRLHDASAIAKWTMAEPEPGRW